MDNEVAKTHSQKNVEEIKYLWVLLKSAIGERYYKEFVSDFFKKIKTYETPLLQDIIDTIDELLKIYNIATTKDTTNDLIDYLERMRNISNKKKFIDHK